MGRRGMTAEEADDHVSEFGTNNPAGVDHAEERRASLSLAAVLVAMADEERHKASETAIRANEMDAWTDTWSPELQDEGWFERRAQQAEAFREEAAIHRRRQTALEAGAEALGAILPT